MAELFDALDEGGWVEPVPMVQSDPISVIEGRTRSFWVMLGTLTSHEHLVRLHVLRCLLLAPNAIINICDRHL